MSTLLPLILEHLVIVLIATAISIVLGIILGVLAYWVPLAKTVILWLAEAIQTIPSLALLAMLMILLGLGNTTIIAGLVLYALLPIVRNTHTGLSSVSPAVKDAARGMGMSKLQRLLQVELPLAFPMVFSGIRISVVNSLSIAVMGVLIGAGGLGYPVYRGIQTQNLMKIMSGAIPVMLMAVLFDIIMTRVETRLVKRAK
jgi:osmoprotectant transport system permease protein